MIANLTGTDFGPQSYESSSYWQKKIISSTSNVMLVEFRSDDVWEYVGFAASIHYSPLTSKECDKGLKVKTIQTPSYPGLYENDVSCKWLITVSHGSHITLQFLQFDVRIFVIFSYAS